MNSNTTSSAASKTAELTLGWKAMPAYGEVMTTLIGTAHTDVASSMRLEKKSILSSFWSTLSNLK